MSHNESRDSWKKEFLAATIGGVAYGVINTIVGHPMDTVKTNMQIEPSYKGKNMIQSIFQLKKNNGLLGFYKGVTSPLLGSIFFRSLQFSVFEAVYTYLGEKKSNFYDYKIPFTFGLQVKVILGGIASGTARAVVECPFEYSKVNLQIGQSWELRKMFQGFKSLFIRDTGLMTFAFILMDSFRRNTNAFNHPVSTFFMQGFIGAISFILIWPLEIAKNQIQGMKNASKENTKILQILKLRYKEYGFAQGLYRGILPGVTSIFLRNGASMIGMVQVQKMLTKYGFRNNKNNKNKKE